MSSSYQEYKKPSEWRKIFFIFLGAILFGGLMFLVNNFTSIFNTLIFITQAILGAIFGIWYIRLFFVYLKELRKKDEEKKVGIPLGWSIYGIISVSINFVVWAFLSAQAFNFPKLLFLIPFALGLVQIFYVFIKANRRSKSDWLIIIFNVISFIYLFIWTLIDFGVDFPGVLGVLAHTVTSSMMWWQLIYVNTGAFFSPTFIFPPILLNPRYFFAQPIEDYIKDKEKEIAEFEAQLEEKSSEEKEISVDEKQEEKSPEKPTEKILPGDRVPFYVERKKQRDMTEELVAIRQKMLIDDVNDDQQYAHFIGVTDVGFNVRKWMLRLDSLMRIIGVGVILILIIITPVTFAGNISMNVLPAYDKQVYYSKPGMALAIEGSVFSTPSFEGYYTSDWYEKLIEELQWAKQIHATHIRYDIESSVLSRNESRAILSEGFQIVKDSGLELIISLLGEFSFTKEDYYNNIYEDASFVTNNYEPDYLLVYNEINGELFSNLGEGATFEELIVELSNVTNKVKTLDPGIQVATSVLAVSDGPSVFEMLLNDSVPIDIVGIDFFPLFFGWRTKTLLNYANIYEQSGSSKDFWLTEFGMESLNYGEEAQAKFLAKILSMASDPSSLNADGVCIRSLIDNLGFTVERGITSHFGLRYFNGRKKIAFDGVKFGFGRILGI
ncbi:MAG: hypothetical protein ACTSO7_03840 [Candidatus Heimdallarchaeota archaeon]